MKKLGHVYQLFNLLSLDVAVGAVVSALFFAKIFQVHILIYGLGSLGLSVWIIYTADHLIDAKRLESPASSERHRFHQKYFRNLGLVLLAALLIDAVLISFIRKPLLESGLVLAGVVMIYFLIQRYLKSLKELSGALLYSCGVLLPAWSLSNHTITSFQILLVVQFMMTVLCNMILFSWFDHGRDVQDNYYSIVTVVGNRNARLLLSGLFLLNGALVALQFLQGVQALEAVIVIASMNFILLVIFVFHRLFETHDFYRLFGDAVFLVPLTYFLV